MIGGVAGDMLLGAWVDAGIDARELERALRGVVAGGWEMTVERVDRRGIAATHLDLVIPGEDFHENPRPESPGPNGSPRCLAGRHVRPSSPSRRRPRRAARARARAHRSPHRPTRPAACRPPRRRSYRRRRLSRRAHDLMRERGGAEA